MKNLPKLFFLLLMAGSILILSSCKDDNPCDDVTCNDNSTCFEGDCVCEDGWIGSDCDIRFFTPNPDIQAQVEEAFILMEDGDIIEFGPGTFDFISTLSLDDKNNITIRGAGMDQTILSFANQTAGAEGMKVTNVTQTMLRDFTIQNTVGDGIKVTDSDGITFYQVGAEWTGPISEESGAYGLYPVVCQNVLMDGCYVRGASDAGIYVGQSEKIIVRNSTATENVAGIEIENCNNADVYNNHAFKNTGGILIFSLPGLTIKNGQMNRVYDNLIEENDIRNFAPAGNIVGSVPSGTGIMLLTAQNVEIFNNTINKCNVMGIGIVSYPILQFFDPGQTTTDTEYDLFCKNIYIHDNTMNRTNVYPTEQNAVGQTLQDVFPDGDMRDVVHDGMVHPDNQSDPSGTFCIKNSGSFVNMELIILPPTFDASIHDCTQAPISEAVVNAPTP